MKALVILLRLLSVLKIPEDEVQSYKTIIALGGTKKFWGDC